MADNLDPEIQRQLNEELEKFKDSVSGMVPAMVLMTAAMKEQIAASKGLSGAEKDGKSVVDEWLKAQSNETQASKAAAEATKKYNEAMNNLNMALYSGAASLASFGKSLLTVGGGMSKYSAGVDMAGDALGNLAKGALGPLGTVIAGVTKAFSMLVGAVLKQNDNMLKGTDALAQMGIIGDITTDKFKEMGAQAGYSGQRLEELSGIYKYLGSGITGLGATAAEGAKSFNKIIEADEGVLQQYSRLGVTQNQLNKNQADYIKLQLASGQQITERSKQDGSLRKASLEYTDNLLQLSAITGENVEEIQKQQAINRAQLDVATRLASMQDKEEALRAKAIATGDEQYEVQAKAIAGERKRTEALQDMASMMGMSSKEMAGFNSMLATGNFNELSAGFAAGTPGILEFIDSVKKGTKAPEELRLFMAEATKRTRETMGEAIIQNKEIGENVAYSSGLLKNEAKLRGMSAEQYAKQIADDKAAMEEAKKNGKDAAKDGRAAQETAERRMQIASDSLVSVVQGPITKAFEMFQKAMTTVAKYLAKFAVWLGAPDFTDMFKTPDEVKEEQEKNAEAIKKVTQEIARVKKLSGRGMGTSLPGLEKQKLLLEEQQKKLAGVSATQAAAPAVSQSSASTSSGMTGYLQKIAQVESGGKASAEAKGTSASGLFQFTKGTWEETTKEMGKKYSLEDRFDPQKSAEVAKYFTEKQKKQLQTGTGKENVSDADLYMAHFLGAGGATKFLNAMAKNPSALAVEGASPDQIEKNKPIFYEDGGKGKMRTLQEVYDLMARKLDKSAEVIAAGKGGEDIGKIQQGRFGGVFSGSESGYPVMLHGKEIVIPMPDTNSLDVKKTELGEAGATSNTTQNITENNTANSMTAMYDMINMLATKLDSVVDHLATGNDYTDQILKYSRV